MQSICEFTSKETLTESLTARRIKFRRQLPMCNNSIMHLLYDLCAKVKLLTFLFLFYLCLHCTLFAVISCWRNILDKISRTRSKFLINKVCDLNDRDLKKNSFLVQRSLLTCVVILSLFIHYLPLNDLWLTS